MKKLITLLAFLISNLSYSQNQELDFSLFEKQNGFIDFFYDESKGRVYAQIPTNLGELLYMNSLSQGLGSNDIGLDRGQLGNERVVYFKKMGGSLMLIEKNLKYRAVSDNIEEVKAVEEAFAKSVLWGFPILQSEGSTHKIDMTPFLLRDAHGVAHKLANLGEGTYKVDESRSAINKERTKNFPDNTELDALITLTGKPTGKYIQTIGPDVNSLSVYQHHSFMRLPDDSYEPRVFDPRCGYYPISYFDYATPIHAPIERKFISLHRLETKTLRDGSLGVKDPIVYYLDRGCPEPIRSALIDGALWWNEAFSQAGYRDAFQVKMLPEGVDPMDIRYNVIQWVHRSTRGWSYGSSITDPRTGEILKGHVSLGSLRVRQDYLIAQGIDRAYNGIEDDPLLEMALARLRQLAAHEVGHTLGLAHNFAGSTNERSSVMDYPYPIITLADDGTVDFSDAYDDGIGDWDKRTILYGYGSVENDPNLLDKVLEENEILGLRYISDRDARPLAGSHPEAHLWDNGADAVVELDRLMDIRYKALAKFSTDNLQKGMPLSELEAVLVPLYLSHRYQIEAVSKLIGGVRYDYGVNDDNSSKNEIISPKVQERALAVLLKALSPDFLTIPQPLMNRMLPRAMGYSDTQEHFERKTGLNFDPVSAAASAAQLVMKSLLHPERLNRISIQHGQLESIMAVDFILKKIDASLNKKESGLKEIIRKETYSLFIENLMTVYQKEELFDHVRADIYKFLEEQTNSTNAYQNHLIRTFLDKPMEYKPRDTFEAPAGSPIGCSAN